MSETQPSIRVKLTKAACCGYGACVEICPQVYQLDDSGIVRILIERIPPNLQAEAREGAAACPTSALEIVDA